MSVAQAVHSRTSWWQTAVATLLAYALFLPALLIVGIIPLIYRMWIAKWLHIEESQLSHWVSFFQYNISTFTAAFAPVLFLKRANPTVVALLFGGPLVLLFLASFVLSVTGRLGYTDSFGLWDDLVSTAGVAFGAGSAAYQRRNR